VQDLHSSFDSQIQKLQILELNWSQDTIELLRSSRHDLVNQLEKTKTGFNDILSEVYEKVITPYKNDILENQKNTRQHIEDLTAGRLRKISVFEIKENLLSLINNYNEKLKPYIQIELQTNISDANLYCYANRLLFIAVNNIVDNSVFALQKLLLNDGFVAKVFINLEIINNFLHIKITDNAGGIEDEILPKIYREQIKSSKGNRFGEGTIHSAYFIKILNGKIIAENVNKENFKGLQTDIILPVKEE
jgi:sensor histidine kinase regulating citrate/malate metabolism